MTLPATPEQAALLSDLLERWDVLLTRLEALPEPAQDAKTTLKGSRRILENYRRVLRSDLARGIEKVPASELFRAIGTAEASLKQLSSLETLSGS